MEWGPGLPKSGMARQGLAGWGWQGPSRQARPEGSERPYQESMGDGSRKSSDPSKDCSANCDILESGWSGYLWGSVLVRGTSTTRNG